MTVATTRAGLLKGQLTDNARTYLYDTALGLPASLDVIDRDFLLGRGTNPDIVSARAYGATGDGTTDDTTAIQTALTAAAGKMLYIPPGTYIVTSALRPASNTTIFGAGMGATTLKRTAVSTGFIINPANTASRIAIRDLTVDGNYPTNAVNSNAEITANSCTDFLLDCVEVRAHNSIGINAAGTSVRIRNCVMRGPASATVGASFGIWLDAASSLDVLIDGCDIQDYRLNAIYGGGIGLRIVNCYFAGNHRQTSVGGGQIAWGPSTLSGHLVQGNHFGAGGGTVTSGLEIDNVDDLIVADNFITSQGNYGIILQGGANVVLSGNTIKNSVLGYGINVGPGVSQFRLVGNRCYDDQGVKTQAWGISIEAGASDNYAIVGNDVRGNVNTAGLIDNGTGVNKQVEGNLPLAADAWLDTASTITLTQGVSCVPTVNYARYRVIGKTAHVQIKITAGGAGTPGSDVVIGGLPAVIAPKRTGGDTICGSGVFTDTGTAKYVVAADVITSSTVKLVGYNANGYFGAAPAVTVASTDVVSLDLAYEVA